MPASLNHLPHRWQAPIFVGTVRPSDNDFAIVITSTVPAHTSHSLDRSSMGLGYRIGCRIASLEYVGIQ